MTWFVNHDTPNYFEAHILEHGKSLILLTTNSSFSLDDFKGLLVSFTDLFLRSNH